MNKYLNLLRNICLCKMEKPYPFSGVFWVTDKCNSRCKTCHIWNVPLKNEMRVDMFKKVFEESRLLRRLSLITFTGGEPFLNEDLPAFVEVANKYSSVLAISFATNGLAADKIISKLKNMLAKGGAPINVKLSIDGIEDVHDNIRGVIDAFKKSMETLAQMLELRSKYPTRLSISIGFTATALNYQQIPFVIELAKKNNVDFFYKPVMYAQILHNEEIDKSLFLSQKQLVLLAEYHKMIISNTKKSEFKKRYLYASYLNFLNKYYKKPDRYIPCYACLSSFHVSVDWNVFSCLSCSYVLGNLKDASFDAIFRGKEASSVRGKIKKSRCHCLCTGEIFPSIIVRAFPLFT